MRKILLATTALVAFAGAAQAAESPIEIKVGGYVDFRAAMFHESTSAVNMGMQDDGTTAQTDRRDHDFETEYRLNISAEGKSASGIEYGGLVSLWNGADYNDNYTGGGNTVHEDQGYVWMSSAKLGKVIFGDEHGASDLFVYAPTVGEGQIDGTYTDFVDPTTLTQLGPSYISNTENNTKVTYYTPQVPVYGKDHTIQVGASYTPNFNDQGQNVVKYENDNGSDEYHDFVEASAQYNGNWGKVGTILSATMNTGRANNAISDARDFTSWGLGAQATYAGFTLGGSYVDAGHFMSVKQQDKEQYVWSAGLKYENGAYAVAVNGLMGAGYNNNFAQSGNVSAADRVNYVKDFSAIGLGATYTWFPGLTTAADLTFFDQQRADTVDASGNDDRANVGQVLMLSQKITF